LTWPSWLCSHSDVFGTPDLPTALVLVAAALFMLFALLSYHAPSRQYPRWGVGLLGLVLLLTLLTHAFDRPTSGTALMLALVAFSAMLALMTFHSRRAGHGLWWVGVALALLSLPMIGAGRGDLALIGLVGGPLVLMLVAVLQPQVPAFYSHIGDASPGVSAQDLAVERTRYARLAGIIIVGTLAGLWIAGGVPRGEVIEAATPLTVDQAAAERGAALFQQYGCVACHSTTSTAPGVGPGLKGVGNRRERLDNGSTVLASEAYITESILSPDAKTVSGFSKGVMASAIAAHQTEIRQTANLRALVEFVKSLK
jgi:mono/diheme cytochrome c family protein